MAIITSEASLALTTDIVIDTTALTIQIKTTGAVTSAGSTGGVTDSSATQHRPVGNDVDDFFSDIRNASREKSD